jgi:hypothetical protein
MCSVWTLVFMALDRFLAVVYPFHAIRFRNIKNAVILCTALWLVSFIVYTPIIPIYTVRIIHSYIGNEKSIKLTKLVICTDPRV